MGAQIQAGAKRCRDQGYDDERAEEFGKQILTWGEGIRVQNRVRVTLIIPVYRRAHDGGQQKQTKGSEKIHHSMNAQRRICEGQGISAEEDSPQPPAVPCIMAISFAWFAIAFFGLKYLEIILPAETTEQRY